MREPTTSEAAYWWHSQALALVASGAWRGRKRFGGMPYDPDRPQLGWYRRRLIRGGPWVPGIIWMTQAIDPETGQLIDDERLWCEVDHRPAVALDEWPFLAPNPISIEQFERLSRPRDRVHFPGIADTVGADPGRTAAAKTRRR